VSEGEPDTVERGMMMCLGFMASLLPAGAIAFEMVPREVASQTFFLVVGLGGFIGWNWDRVREMLGGGSR